MNEKLITIDDDSLDLVAGGATFSFNPAQAIADALKGFYDALNHTISITFGIQIDGKDL